MLFFVEIRIFSVYRNQPDGLNEHEPGYPALTKNTTNIEMSPRAVVGKKKSVKAKIYETLNIAKRLDLKTIGVIKLKLRFSNNNNLYTGSSLHKE